MRKNTKQNNSFYYHKTIDIHYDIDYNCCILNKRSIMNLQQESDIVEQIHTDVLKQDEDGLLENDIIDVVIETGLHADDDRDEILMQIVEERFEALC